MYNLFRSRAGTRPVEVLLACLTVSVGLTMLNPFTTNLTHYPAFTLMADAFSLPSAGTWGSVFTLVGVLQLWAVWQGRLRFRLYAAVISFTLWFFATIFALCFTPWGFPGLLTFSVRTAGQFWVVARLRTE